MRVFRGFWVVVGLWALSAQAQSRPPLLVLDLDSKNATPLQVGAATQGVVRGLRELDVFQVMSADDVRQLLALERTRQLSGAKSDGQALASLSSSLGAKNAVVGSITKLADGFNIEIRLLDSPSSKVLAQKNLTRVTIEKAASELPGLAQELVAPLLREEQGQLLVHSREESAEILVDDTLVGSTPQAKALDVPRGMHRVQIRKDGFIAQTRPVRIEPRQLHVEEVTLLPSPDYAEAYQMRHHRLRVGAVIATTAAVVLIAGGIVVDRVVTEPTYEKEFLPRQLWLKAQVSGSQAPPKLADGAYDAWALCPGQADVCREKAQQLQGQITAQEIISGSMIGVGIISAGVATYLWLTGQDPNRYANLVAGVSVTKEQNMFVLGGRF